MQTFIEAPVPQCLIENQKFVIRSAISFRSFALLQMQTG